MSTSASQESKPHIEYRHLGKSGLRVSVPILGAMSFGSDKWLPWVVNEDKALPLLKAAWDLGVTTWDTANMYSNGESERIIGKALKQYKILRERVIILTKAYMGVADDMSIAMLNHLHLRDTRDYANELGLSRAALFNQVSGSLARLDTTYIDLLQIHRADLDNVSAEETMKALHDLVQSGKVRYIGASSMWTWQFQHYNHVAEKNGWTTFISMQDKYSLAYREEEREMIKYCNYAGIGLIPYSPLNRGALTHSLGTETRRAESNKKLYNLEVKAAEEEIVRRVEKVATDKGWLMSQVALAWVKDRVTSPIVGFSSEKRLKEAIIPGYKLTEEEVKFLEEPYQPMNVDTHR